MTSYAPRNKSLRDYNRDFEEATEIHFLCQSNDEEIADLDGSALLKENEVVLHLA
jgi:hypothetical protein